MLRLSLACWDYDRTRALADGRVQPEGIDLIYLNQPVEETFFRMMRFQEFDASEMSLSSYVASLGRAEPPFIAIPAFPSRYFRHSCIFVSAKSGIRKPEELKGRKVGVPEYQMTAPVWIRGILSDDYGVKVTECEHFSGGEEEPGRDEKLKRLVKNSSLSLALGSNTNWSMLGNWCGYFSRPICMRDCSRVRRVCDSTAGRPPLARPTCSASSSCGVARVASNGTSGLMPIIRSMPRSSTVEACMVRRSAPSR